MAGRTGSFYLIETAPDIQAYIQALNKRFSGLPLSLKRVLTSHFPPLGVSLSEVREFFNTDDYEILESGHSSLGTNLELENDKCIELPAVFALIRPAEAKTQTRS